jgi:hypothetical protein
MQFNVSTVKERTPQDVQATAVETADSTTTPAKHWPYAHGGNTIFQTRGIKPFIEVVCAQ